MKRDKIWDRGIGMGIRLVLLSVLTCAVAWGANIGPDGFGYVATEDTPYGFVDVSGTGAAVLGGADDDRMLLNVGFPFSFYGNSYTSVCVSSNGLVSLGSCNTLDFANQDMSATAPSGDYPTIAPLWFDLTFAVEGAGAVYYQTLGEPGDRRFVVQWQNAYVLNGTKGITFQVVLSEGSGEVLFQYLDIDAGMDSSASFGGVATVGIRDTGGQANGRSLQWSYKAPVLRNEAAILFTTAPIAGRTVTIRLVDSHGKGLAGGTAKYYDGKWKSIAGSTDGHGELATGITDLKEYTFMLTYT
jgi:hypothetical protein